ncbi:MAG: hypothetical protein GYA87_04140 [Christensenellaceae bacterium]|nr:hypothetical protein [Christensenellaceae bacterium]
MKKIFKKIYVAILPLIFLFVLVLINNYILNMIKSKFLRFSLIGIFLGSGLSLLTSFSQLQNKSYETLKLYRASAIILFIILLYQYFTYTGDVIIPALSILNIVDPTIILLEGVILGYTTLISININDFKKNRKK